MHCPRCKADVRGSGKGRPPTYCGEPCRRAAEYELRRIQRGLEKSEDRLREWRRKAVLIEADKYRGIGSLDNAEVQIAVHEAEIAELEERLRLLLAAGSE